MKVRTKSASFNSVELAQAALWESADRFRQPADHVCRVLCLLNVAIGEVLHPNDAFKTVFGRPSKSGLRKPPKSGSKQAIVWRFVEDGQLVIQVKDDGAGFELPENWSQASGHGLIHDSRAGTISRRRNEIDSVPGTRVSISAPLTACNSPTFAIHSPAGGKAGLSGRGWLFRRRYAKRARTRRSTSGSFDATVSFSAGKIKPALQQETSQYPTIS